jgi:glutamate--cysteine ligase
VLEIARRAVDIAKAGLKRRAVMDAEGRDETKFLEPVDLILNEGCTPAEELLARFEGPWQRSTRPLYTEFVF